MTILVTGSSGHLGEALIRTLHAMGRDVIGLDIVEGAFTTRTGSIADRATVRAAMAGVSTVLHTATLHKPHVVTHARQDFVDVNVSGTLNLLEEAVAQGVARFVFTSTTSVFGDALIPPDGKPAAWITEDVVPVPKNIYGVSKLSAENLCRLFHRNQRLPCIVLRTSRFFPEADDSRAMRESYADGNIKANEYLSRRVDIEDVVSAHLAAAQRARDIGFGCYIVSATTPYRPEDLAELRTDAPAVTRRRVHGFAEVYERLGWRMFPTLDRVYINDEARRDLGWKPRHDFSVVVSRLGSGNEWQSPLARQIGSKGYHTEPFEDGPFPVE